MLAIHYKSLFIPRHYKNESHLGDANKLDLNIASQFYRVTLRSEGDTNSLGRARDEKKKEEKIREAVTLLMHR